MQPIGLCIHLDLQPGAIEDRYFIGLFWIFRHDVIIMKSSEGVVFDRGILRLNRQHVLQRAIAHAAFAVGIRHKLDRRRKFQPDDLIHHPRFLDNGPTV